MNDLVPDHPEAPEPQNTDKLIRDEARQAVVDVLRGFTFNGRPLGIQGSNIVVSLDTQTTRTVQPQVGFYSVPPPQVTSPSLPQTPSDADPLAQSPTQIPNVAQVPRPQPAQPQQVVQLNDNVEQQPLEPVQERSTTVINPTTVRETQSPRNHPQPNQSMNHAGPIRVLGGVAGVPTYLLITAQLNGSP